DPSSATASEDAGVDAGRRVWAGSSASASVLSEKSTREARKASIEASRNDDRPPQKRPIPAAAK
ncbi:hypothetical protein, partial [Burkholderia pseudomallei]|uniref:hypothetical protein n=1 Tax=Burkholderia pseudomallei TaxID=28450 RepID=UPI0019402905